MKRSKHIARMTVIIVVAIIVGLALYFGYAWKMERDVSQAIQEKIDSELVPGENMPLGASYTNAVYSAITFEVQHSDGKKAQVAFTYPDVIALADQNETDKQEADAFYQHCIDTIHAGEYPQKDKTISVEYEKDKNGKIKIQASPELADVLTGGAYSVYARMIAEEES